MSDTKPLRKALVKAGLVEELLGVVKDPASLEEGDFILAQRA